MTYFDHIAAIVMLVAWPLYVARNGGAELEELCDPEKRGKMLRNTFLIQWTFTATLLGVWVYEGRSFPALGLGTETPIGFWILGALVVLAFAHQIRALGRLRSQPERCAEIRSQGEHLQGLLPTNAKEQRTLDYLSVTAGICEEIAYRGFVYWYLTHWMPGLAAVAIGSLAFGAVHLYEGKEAAGRIVILSVITFGLYLGTGSLWIPMVAHTALDMLQVRMLTTVFDESSGDLELAGEPTT